MQRLELIRGDRLIRVPPDVVFDFWVSDDEFVLGGTACVLAEGNSNHEISERLFLALSTVKGHNRNIFGKLQVQRRTEAVARARELGLL